MEHNGVAVKIRDLKMYFARRSGLIERRYVKAVDGVNLDLYTGETLAVVGESGSGKTTLGKTLLRLYTPTGGSIEFDGKDITHKPESELKWYRKVAQIIYQDPFSSLNPFFSVYRILEEPLIVHNVGSQEERKKRITETMHDVKLEPIEDFARKNPHMMSGGQRQRVAIGRALILNPKLIVADEPVSMLDASVRVEILYLLRGLQKEHDISFAYITHDIATVKYFSERMATMYAGRVVELAGTRQVISKPLHPYTQALIEAIPDPDPTNRHRNRNVPAGEPPDLSNPPPGCNFHPRCPFAMDICRGKEPTLEEVQPGHRVACWLHTEYDKPRA